MVRGLPVIELHLGPKAHKPVVAPTSLVKSLRYAETGCGKVNLMISLAVKWAKVLLVVGV